MTKGIYALVGMKFRPPGTEQLVASLPNGEPLTLIREATNKFDPNAVQVWARDQHIGYISAKQNRPIAMAMDRAIEIKAQGIAGGVMNAKLAIDGGRWPMVELSE